MLCGILISISIVETEHSKTTVLHEQREKECALVLPIELCALYLIYFFVYMKQASQKNLLFSQEAGRRLPNNLQLKRKELFLFKFQTI